MFLNFARSGVSTNGILYPCFNISKIVSQAPIDSQKLRLDLTFGLTTRPSLGGGGGGGVAARLLSKIEIRVLIFSSGWLCAKISGRMLLAGSGSLYLAKVQISDVINIVQFLLYNNP